MAERRAVTIGQGSYGPPIVVKNDAFRDARFLKKDGTPHMDDVDGRSVERTADQTVDEFPGVSGIYERRYAPEGMVTSDAGVISAQEALEQAQEVPQLVTFSHNFGDVLPGRPNMDLVPAWSARLKAHLEVANPFVIAEDIIAGNMGWFADELIASSTERGGNTLLVGPDFYEQLMLVPSERARELIGRGNPETLDGIIVTNNVDLLAGREYHNGIESLAAKAAGRLHLPESTITYDNPWGCAGYVRAKIRSAEQIQKGLVDVVLNIAADLLSRVADKKHDRDAMLYGDDSGSTVMRALVSDLPVGILASISASYAMKYADALTMGPSNNKQLQEDFLYLKMDGGKVFKGAVGYAPSLMIELLNRAGITPKDVKIFNLHQANLRILQPVIYAVLKHFEEDVPPKGDEAAMDAWWRDLSASRIPITIHNRANTSLGSTAVINDRVWNKDASLGTYELRSGDIIDEQSFGAGLGFAGIIERVSEFFPLPKRHVNYDIRF
ncbi:MAG: hypothetical protein ABIA93_06980 [Candidatus Woesearchaeota archaeon]